MTTETPTIEVTDSAAEKLREVLDEQNKSAAMLRIMVMPSSGCGGGVPAIPPGRRWRRGSGPGPGGGGAGKRRPVRGPPEWHPGWPGGPATGSSAPGFAGNGRLASRSARCRQRWNPRACPVAFLQGAAGPGGEYGCAAGQG